MSMFNSACGPHVRLDRLVTLMRPARAHTYTHTQPYLVAGPALETVGVELVDVEDMDGTLNAEVVELAGHFKVQQVILERKQDQGKKRK